MKVKTLELTGTILDWFVAKCEGFNKQEAAAIVMIIGSYTPSVNWSQGGPIIEREKIKIFPCDLDWEAQDYNTGRIKAGHTPLIAAMRCYVASKLGDDVEIPGVS